jgi:hypothetical protein
MTTDSSAAAEQTRCRKANWFAATGVELVLGVGIGILLAIGVLVLFNSDTTVGLFRYQGF